MKLCMIILSLFHDFHACCTFAATLKKFHDGPSTRTRSSAEPRDEHLAHVGVGHYNTSLHSFLMGSVKSGCTVQDCCSCTQFYTKYMLMMTPFLSCNEMATYNYNTLGSDIDNYLLDPLSIKQ